MIKLKRLSIEKIEPSMSRKGQVEFSFHDCYLRKDLIGGIVMINNEYSLNDNWAQKEIKDYCKDNNLCMCTIYTIEHMPNYDNIVVNETIKDLIEQL